MNHVISTWKWWWWWMRAQHSLGNWQCSVKPWLNGTPNSSQVANSKLASAGGQTIPPNRASLQETVQLSEYDRVEPHINTKQLDDSWLELAEVAKRWKTWLEVGENLSLIKLKPTRANSSQVGGRTIPNSIEVVNLARIGLSWEDRLALVRDFAGKVVR